MNIVGLDLSLSATGVGNNDGLRTLAVKLPKDASDLQRTQRLQRLAGAIDLECAGADLVVIEGHSFGSQQTHAHSLGELHGVVKVCLYQRRIPFVLVPPTRLKKYATGKGNASKDGVLIAAVKAAQTAIHNNNEADAFWLWSMATVAYGDRAPLNQVRQEVLGSIEWPELKREEVTI